MAARHSDPIAQLVGLYLAVSLFLILVVFASPFFLAGAAALIGFRLYRKYQNSPQVLARRAHAESLALYRHAKELTERAALPDAEAFAALVIDKIAESCSGVGTIPEFLAHIQRGAEWLYALENFGVEDLPPPADPPEGILDWRYQDLIKRHIAKMSEPAILDLAVETFADAALRFLGSLPPQVLQENDVADATVGAQFTLPLVEAAADIRQAVEALILPFYETRPQELHLFAAVRQQFDRNLYTVSGLPFDPAMSAKLVFPSEHQGRAEEIVSGYLRHTPFEALFALELPFSIPPASRLEHWHLVAGSGHGKTQTLQHIILGDLIAEEQPALVIVDSQGDMLKKIARLELFEQSDRLVVIDPEDDVAPALNMFDVPNSRSAGYSRAVREQMEAGLIELFNYVFGALASELTAKQGTAFAYITRLMLSIPGATIHTFRELMESANPAEFAPYVEKLDPTARAFFKNQFFNKNAFGETRQQIARRLYTVLQVPAFERMFTSEKNRLDMFEALQNGKVVLINTSKALLKTDASALFGRYMIALTLNAAFERVAVPEGLRRPTYLIIDEAAEYFDETLERLLAQARKYKLGVLFAHQHMEQLTPALRSAVAANTSVKMAGGLSDHDARALAADMRAQPSFLTSMRKQGRSTEFACYVRNQTERAVRVRVPFGTLEDAPKMSCEAHRKLLQRNRARYGLPQEPEPMTVHHPDLPWKLEPTAPSRPASPDRGRLDPDEIDMKPSAS